MIGVALAGGARAVFTGTAEGDMGHGGRYMPDVDPPVAARRRAVVDLPWTWLRQVHGPVVVTVDAPAAAVGVTGDALVTATPGCALAVLTADCAPVVLASPEGVVGVAHAGWRGLAAGVLERTVGALRGLGAGRLQAVVGPCIGTGCYEFGEAELVALAARVGPGVRGATADGRPALDLVAGVRASLGRAGVVDVDDQHAACTACGPGWYSWRARGQTERQAAVVWR
ncbi:MAG: polyphenol oxidase family protein [Acidimicrobiales bacterium]